jgi:WD40 repeat protein
LNAHDSPINSISWAKKEKRFATASSDKSIKIWEEISGHFVEIGKLEKHKELVRDV